MKIFYKSKRRLYSHFTDASLGHLRLDSRTNFRACNLSHVTYGWQVHNVLVVEIKTYPQCDQTRLLRQHPRADPQGMVQCFDALIAAIPESVLVDANVA